VIVIAVVCFNNQVENSGEIKQRLWCDVKMLTVGYLGRASADQQRYTGLIIAVLRIIIIIIIIIII
jgi:hypothetical protein